MQFASAMESKTRMAASRSTRMLRSGYSNAHRPAPAAKIITSGIEDLMVTVSSATVESASDLNDRSCTQFMKFRNVIFSSNNRIYFVILFH